jgi:hypothetical protein
MPAEEYERILARLDEAPSLVRRPMLPEEIDAVEHDVGIRMPAGVRAWLGKVGLNEEISCVDGSDFELYLEREDLVYVRECIVDMLGDKGSDLFPFGHDGDDNDIAVREREDGENELILVDHETESAKVHSLLRDWMNDVVTEAVSRADEGDEKFWCVQFTFECPDELPIFEAMTTLAPVKLPDHDWLKDPNGPSAFKVAKRAFVFLGQGRTLRRTISKQWTTPHYSFHYEEPYSTPDIHSTIRKLDAVFRSRPELKHEMIDNGPQEWPLYYAGDGAEPESTTALTKPWWMFW